MCLLVASYPGSSTWVRGYLEAIAFLDIRVCIYRRGGGEQGRGNDSTNDHNDPGPLDSRAIYPPLVEVDPAHETTFPLDSSSLAG